MGILSEKKLLIGVSGGIASYKVCEVIRQLTDLGASIQVVLTKHAANFVTPLTFETLTNQPALTEMFPEDGMVATRHIDVPRMVDRLLICPATANLIGKIASGIADDLLSTMIMVAGAEKITVCPAMNTDMWFNPIVQKNVDALRELGYSFIDPEFGELACRTEGIGKLASVERIVSRMRIELLYSNVFKGKNFLITAGPTRELMDPVRYLTNASSGKMGYALAEAALSRGANVKLIAGPTVLDPPEGATLIEVNNAVEMEEAVKSSYPSTDILVMAAAVADYAPIRASRSKIKKGKDDLTLGLRRTPDILGSLAKSKEERIHVGFAMETENLVANARKKMQEKNLDLIVANNLLVEGAGFETDTNVATIIDREGREMRLPNMSKRELALTIMDEVAAFMETRSSPIKSAIHV
jgi:phosphopantothenoylcysteine decarboxylase/phosphopantothenate--cysteine ligase